jgi:hypothetical protein
MQRPVHILEIGSWEGRSALFFLNYLSRSRIVCIDTFGGNIEHRLDPYFADLAPRTEGQFDSNLAELMDRVEKIKGQLGQRADAPRRRRPPVSRRIYRREPHGSRRVQRRVH